MSTDRFLTDNDAAAKCSFFKKKIHTFEIFSRKRCRCFYFYGKILFNYEINFSPINSSPEIEFSTIFSYPEIQTRLFERPLQTTHPEQPGFHPKHLMESEESPLSFSLN